MESKTEEKNNSYRALYYAASALLPGVFLFYLYNQNRVMNNLFFKHVLILWAVLVLISVAMFLIYKMLCRSCEGAFVVLLLSWVFFWLFEALHELILKYLALQRKSILAFIIAICIALLIWMIRRHGSGMLKFMNAFLFAPLIICVLFLLNFTPALYNAVVVQLRSSPTERSFDIKTQFVTDLSLPSPDVYWLHMDEFIGFNAAEKYFGDALDDLKADLTARGFAINEDAELKIGYTNVALPAMLSPTFYDSYLRRQVSEAEHLLRVPRQNKLTERFEHDGINLNRDVVPFQELYAAFKSKGYAVIVTETLSGGVFPFDYLYRSDDKLPLMTQTGQQKTEAEALKELARLMSMTTPLSVVKDMLPDWIDGCFGTAWEPIPTYEAEINRLIEGTYGIKIEKQVYRRLLDSLSVPSPKLTYLVNYVPHSPYDQIYETGKAENPSPDNDSAVDLLYLQQYKYAAEVMLITIDMILERDPNAVIVLQADHGIHVPKSQRYLLRQGYSEAQVLELNYSVFSAVRLPEKYGKLDEPIEPLNISRMLVNRFVGENYELLPR